MLTDISVIRALCARHHIRPDKRFGQNFLIDTRVLEDIVVAGQIQPSDTIIEIGAGIGTLTAALAARARRVYAFEVDERLYPVLRETVPYPNTHIIKENILAARAEFDRIIAAAPAGYKIIANLPYQSTGALVRLFLECAPPPAHVVIMVQKEVAERMVSPPGKMSILSVAMRYYTHPRMVRVVSAQAFYPAPRVESAIVAWKPIRPYDRRTDEPFFNLVRAGFTHPRKLLKNNLRASLETGLDNDKGGASPSGAHALAENGKGAAAASGAEISEIIAYMRELGIPETARPGDLTVDEWQKLSTYATKSGVVL